MKKSIRNLVAAGLMLAAAPSAFAQCTPGSTLIVGPADQYAFQWCNGTSVTQIGLNFASSVNEYQFKKTDGTNLMTLNPTGGNYVRMGSPDAGNYAAVSGGGDLTFVGGGDYLVGNNRYAFRSQGDQDNGLYFNVTLNQYEFRDNGALPGLAIKANNSGGDEAGDIVGTGSASFEDEITANGATGQGAVKGSSINGPTNGYLGAQGTTDFDGIVGLTSVGDEIGVLGVSQGGSISDNYGVYGSSNGTGVYATHTGGNAASLGTATYAGDFVGDVRVSGNLEATLNTPVINGLATVTGTSFNNANTIGVFEVENTGLFGNTSLGMDGNEIQAYSGDTATGTLFLNFWGGNMDILNGSSNPNGTLTIGSGNLYVNNVNDRVSVGTTAALGKLHVESTENTEILYLNSTGSPTEMIDINRTVAMTASQDIIDINIPSTSSVSAQIMEVSASGIVYQLNADGHAGFGTTASSLYAIQACGSIRAEEVIVETGWCDFVFDEDYQLASLSDVESFIKTNKHLPGIPSAAEVEGNGLPLAEMSANFMQKIEELTLYTIDQEKEIDRLTAELAEIKAMLSAGK